MLRITIVLSLVALIGLAGCKKTAITRVYQEPAGWYDNSRRLRLLRSNGPPHKNCNNASYDKVYREWQASRNHENLRFWRVPSTIGLLGRKIRY